MEAVLVVMRNGVTTDDDAETLTANEEAMLLQVAREVWKRKQYYAMRIEGELVAVSAQHRVKAGATSINFEGIITNGVENGDERRLYVHFEVSIRELEADSQGSKRGRRRDDSHPHAP